MTKAKEVETETVGGAGATAGLILKRKPNTKSGYYGVIPNGKGWRARVYKETTRSRGTRSAPTPRCMKPLLLWRSRRSRWRRATATFYSPDKQRATTQAGATPPLCPLLTPCPLLHTLILHCPQPSPPGDLIWVSVRQSLPNINAQSPTPPTRAPCGRHLT